MKEIQVGEYIRFYFGEIQKISKEDAKTMNKYYKQYPDIIYKRSSNIIDLIEKRRLCERLQSIIRWRGLRKIHTM